MFYKRDPSLTADRVEKLSNSCFRRGNFLLRHGLQSLTARNAGIFAGSPCVMPFSVLKTRSNLAQIENSNGKFLGLLSNGSVRLEIIGWGSFLGSLVMGREHQGQEGGSSHLLELTAARYMGVLSTSRKMQHKDTAATGQYAYNILRSSQSAAVELIQYAFSTYLHT